MKPISYLLFCLLLLCSACTTVKKTVHQSTTTTSRTLYRDTTVKVHLPQEPPQSLSQELLTNPQWNDTLFIFNTDTLTIESYNLTSKAFVSKNKLYLQTQPKDTTLRVTLKNAIRETETITQKEKNSHVVKETHSWKQTLLLIILFIAFVYFIIPKK